MKQPEDIFTGDIFGEAMKTQLIVIRAALQALLDNCQIQPDTQAEVDVKVQIQSLSELIQQPDPVPAAAQPNTMDALSLIGMKLESLNNSQEHMTTLLSGLSDKIIALKTTPEQLTDAAPTTAPAVAVEIPPAAPAAPPAAPAAATA